MRSIKYLLLVPLVITILFKSCAPTTSASYLSKNQKYSITDEADEEFYTEFDLPDTIHVNDELFITVTTSSDEPNSFSQSSGTVAGNVELLSYLVDEEGYIKLPYIQRLMIAGMTVNEATDTIEAELSQYLYLPTVSIRIINHRFAVLGEVNSPGLYTFNQKALNIYQAIATANDITIFGNRKNVLIVRQNGNRVVKKYVNLLDDNIISSEWYIIHPDDIIFVEPMARKAFGWETIPYDLLFSLFSSTVIAMTFMITLLN